MAKQSNYARGTALERRIQKRESEHPACLYCARSSRSLGPFDLISIRVDSTLLIQVKMRRPSRKELKSLEELSNRLVRRECWVVIKRGHYEEWWKFINGKWCVLLEDGKSFLPVKFNKRRRKT